MWRAHAQATEHLTDEYSPATNLNQLESCAICYIRVYIIGIYYICQARSIPFNASVPSISTIR